MIRRALMAIVVAVLTTIASAQSDPNQSLHLTPRQQDVYAIYSLLMPGAVFSNLGSDQNQRWAIADTTVSYEDTAPPLVPEAALQPPNDHPQRFRDAVVDFEQRKGERQQILK